MVRILAFIMIFVSVGVYAESYDYGRCEEGTDEYYRYTKVEDIEMNNIERKADRIDISICIEEDGKLDININCMNKIKE